MSVRLRMLQNGALGQSVSGSFASNLGSDSLPLRFGGGEVEGLLLRRASCQIAVMSVGLTGLSGEKAQVCLRRLIFSRVRSAALLLAGTASLAYPSTWLASVVRTGSGVQLTPPAPRPPALAAATRHSRRSGFVRGIASWYSDLFEGRQTASGEVFSQKALTACHPTLPFGTLVRVINLRNHRSVVVRINDRGDLNPGRVIDLSSAAAGRLGMLRAGLAMVRLEIVAAPVRG